MFESVRAHLVNAFPPLHFRKLNIKLFIETFSTKKLTPDSLCIFLNHIHVFYTEPANNTLSFSIIPGVFETGAGCTLRDCFLSEIP